MILSQFYAKGSKQINIKTDVETLEMLITSHDGSRVTTAKTGLISLDKSKKYYISFDENWVYLEEAQKVVQADNLR